MDAECVQALQERARVFDHVRIDFDWLQCRAWLKDDPFDPRSWHLDSGSAVLRKCSILILRPDFRLHVVSPVGGEDDTVKTWIDGKRTSMHRGPDGRHAVYIDDSRWATHGVIPYLTPFEMQVCDVQLSLLEMLESGGLKVAQCTDDEVVLAGHSGPQADQREWEVRALLDPRRGLLPVELHADIEFKNRQHIYWTVKTLGSIPLGDIHIMSEAMFALDTSTAPDRWQIYRYKVTGLSADKTMQKGDLAIRVPDKNTWFMDAATGYVRETDGTGRVTLEEQLTPQQMDEREEAIERARQAQVTEYQELRGRRRALFAILGGATVTVALVAGVWLWRRRRQLA